MYLLLSGLSVIPWSFALLYLFPVKDAKKITVIIVFSLLAGHLTTEILFWLHPILWPETANVKKYSHILTQTIHVAFIQAGMLEETFKIAFIMIISLLFSRQDGRWNKEVVLAGGFVALGFSLTENSVYFSKAEESKQLFLSFIGRTVHSVNIHLLINLCFSLFLLKSNESENRVMLLLFAFFLAVMQHGIVDFFLIPSSKIGNIMAAAMFCGIWVWVVKDFRIYVLDHSRETVR